MHIKKLMPHNYQDLLIKTIVILAVCCFAGMVFAGAPQLPNGTGSPDAVRLDDSWHLWLDENAAWKNDPLFFARGS